MEKEGAGATREDTHEFAEFWIRAQILPPRLNDVVSLMYVYSRRNFLRYSQVPVVLFLSSYSWHFCYIPVVISSSLLSTNSWHTNLYYNVYR